VIERLIEMGERHFVVYKDEAEEWRWTLFGANESDKIADSGEGYGRNKDRAIEMAKSINPEYVIKDEQGVIFWDPKWTTETH